jgi:hypothetical protein
LRANEASTQKSLAYGEVKAKSIKRYSRRKMKPQHENC